MVAFPVTPVSPGLIEPERGGSRSRNRCPSPSAVELAFGLLSPSALSGLPSLRSFLPGCVFGSSHMSEACSLLACSLIFSYFAPPLPSLRCCPGPRSLAVVAAERFFFYALKHLRSRPLVPRWPRSPLLPLITNFLDLSARIRILTP